MGRQKIIETAAEMFFRQGFKETTMDDIASSLGMSKKTLYAEFSGKEELVREAVYHIYKRVSGKILEICKADLNPYEEFFRIRSFMREMFKDAQVLHYHQLKKYYPALANELHRKKRDVVMKCLEKNLRKGIRAGYYKKSLDVDFFKRLYFGCGTVLSDTELFPPEEFDKYRIGNAFMMFFLNGISTKEGRKMLKIVQKNFK